jgi:hypothetical protein
MIVTGVDLQATVARVLSNTISVFFPEDMYEVMDEWFCVGGETKVTPIRCCSDGISGSNTEYISKRGAAENQRQSV